MRNARLFVVGLLVLFSARFVSSANAHTTDLNNRVTFYITDVAQTQVQGEAGLVLHAVLDNGTIADNIVGKDRSAKRNGFHQGIGNPFGA